jgi:hypothetical protein
MKEKGGKRDEEGGSREGRKGREGRRGRRKRDRERERRGKRGTGKEEEGGEGSTNFNMLSSALDAQLKVELIKFFVNFNIFREP